MKLFARKKKSVDSVPEEIREYYESDKKESTGIAWLLALGTLIVTIVLAMMLFFAGRWLYRTVSNRGNNTGQTTEQAAQDVKDESSTTTPNTNEAPKTNDNSATNTATPSPQATSTTPTPSTTSASTTAMATAGKTKPLPNTGPGNVLEVFVAVSLLGFLVHRKFLAQN